MRIIGITGGIGSGKSTVADYLLCNYNTYVILTDIIRASLLLPGSDIYYSIIDIYGNDILADEVSIDRDKLYSIIFNNSYELKRYNEMVRPILKQKVQNTLEYFKGVGCLDFIVIESATLFEDELDSLCSDIWYIHSDVKDRKTRLELRGDIDKNIIPNIISCQKMPSEFKKLCNKTIDNNNDVNTLYRIIDSLM